MKKVKSLTTVMLINFLAHVRSWIFYAQLLCCFCSVLPTACSVTVTVNSVEDTWPVDTDSCLVSAAASQSCTLRNALLFCAQSDDFAERECVIQLPTEILNWNATIGEVVISSVPEDLVIVLKGNRAVISMTMGDNEELSSSLLKIEISDNDNSVIDFMIQNATFTNFTDRVFVFKRVNKITIGDAVFLNNQGRKGAGVYVDQTDHMEVNHCQFTGNSASGQGGALYLNSLVNYLNISHSQFNFNSADKGGAIFSFSNNNWMTIEHTIFSLNTALIAGGALLMDSENMFTTVRNSSFVMNSASSGGGVYVNAGAQSLTVSDSNFFSNSAVGGDGGAIQFHNNNFEVSINGCYFESNYAQEKGGAIAFGLFNTVMSVNNTIFASNRAKDHGGGIAIDAFSTVTVDSCSFVSNTVCAVDGTCDQNADSSGGALFYFGVLRIENNLAIARSHFEKNVATSGSAMKLVGNGITLQGCTFTDNSDNAATTDVVVDINVAENVDISDCLFHSHRIGVLSISVTKNVQLKNCNVSATNSTTSAVHILLTVDVLIESCVFENNSAVTGGALLLDSAQNVNIMYGSFLGNSVVSSGGGVYMEGCTSIEVKHALFEGNIAYVGSSMDDFNSGGGLFVLGSSHITFQNNSFVSNNAGSSGGVSSSATIAVGSEDTSMYNSGGALFIKSSDNVIVKDNSFAENSAGSLNGLLYNSGGAMFLEDNEAVEVQGNVFSKNSAGAISTSGEGYNSGGGLFVTSTSALLVVGNTFLECSAAYGGGGALFYMASTGVSVMADGNEYISNSALYGNDLATDAAALVYDDHPPPYQVDLDTFSDARIYTVKVVDLYGNTVANQDALISASAVKSQCGGMAGYIAGQTTAQLIGGSGHLFFTASCYPSATLNVDIAAFEPSHVNSISLQITFRGCRQGEYYSAGSCYVCPNGTYSLASNEDLSVTTCETCPAQASCYGSVITVDDGHWRQSNFTSYLIECPIAGGCVGGAQTGDELCDDRYTGALCGVCQSGYYYEFLSDSCAECTGSNLSITAIITLVLCAIAVVVIFEKMCGKRVLRFIGKQMGVSWLYSKFGRQKSFNLADRKEKLLKSEENSLKIQSKMKQIVTFYQIVSSFPSILSMSLPPVYYNITYIFSFFHVGVFVKDLGLTCSYEGLDYVSLVMASTLCPLLICIALYIVQYVHVYFTFNMYSEAFRDVANTKNRIIVLKSTYFHVFLAFTYLILPGVTTILFGMLKPCVDIDPDNTVAGEDLYLEADYSMKCDTSRYMLGVVWAAVFTLVYPVGIPCMYFCLLYKERHTIKGRAKTNVASLDETGLQNLEAAAIRLSSISFLSQEYHPEYWFFEIVETYRKLFLTSVLSVIDPGSTAQLVVAELFCVFCLILYVVLKPFRDTEMTRTSAVCQVQIWFILFILILLKEDVNMPPKFYTISIAIALLTVMVYVLCWAIVEFGHLPNSVGNFLMMISLPETSQQHRDKGHNGGWGTTDECVERAIEVLALSDPAIDQLRVHETDCHTIKVGKMRNHMMRMEKKRKGTLRHIKKIEKLGVALCNREQSLADDISQMKAQVEVLRDNDSDNEIFSLELKRHDLKHTRHFQIEYSSSDGSDEEDEDEDEDEEGDEGDMPEHYIMQSRSISKVGDDHDDNERDERHDGEETVTETETGIDIEMVNTETTVV